VGQLYLARNCTLASISLYCTNNSAMLHFNFKMNDNLAEQEFSGRRVALGVTGGIAAYKAIEVLRGLQRAGCEVRVTMTKHACEFIQPLTFRALSGSYVLVDDYAADNPDPIAHITFSQTIDLFIIAPATANTLAKLANGVADDFLSSTYLACTGPVLVAPAMNTVMWQHPATRRNLQKLREDGVHLVDPDAGEMACGTFGPGRLSEPERIVSAALELLRQRPQTAPSTGEIKALGQTSDMSKDLSGERLLITAGATREPIDPIRFISNRSSGRMGFALAQAARDRGADVTIVGGITTVDPPYGVRVIHVSSAEEMHSAVIKEACAASIFMAAAAVADYRVKAQSPTKIKKSEADMDLKLERTVDILGDVSRARTKGQLLIGFAAETNDLLANARTKLMAKDLDAIVANDVSREGAGFDSENNAVVILLRDKQEAVELPLLSKLETAHRILDQVVKLRRTRPMSKAFERA
jgi:phosphopantothenoylcysteine decarboxylase/phosphopantothenate--cysteine ligase